MDTKHILIVDDEDDIREVAQLALEAIGGWRVSTANSGIDGLAKAKTEQPDAILLDVMMPDMDGIETFQHLRTNADTQHIPVIFLTAKAQATDQRRFLQIGVTGIITKPFKAMMLADQIAELLRWNT
ncbi:MAG: response regulator [Leptolyngbyaceae cyanobacterium MO_188.B28]|nr:response regulator [Leptolyngbyaceae cyanobacterium MO_188.B28]